MSTLSSLPMAKNKHRDAPAAQATPRAPSRRTLSTSEVKGRAARREEEEEDGEGSDKGSDKEVVRGLIGKEEDEEEEAATMTVPAELAADFQAFLASQAPKAQHASSASAPRAPSAQHASSASAPPPHAQPSGFASRLRERVAPARAAPARSRPVQRLAVRRDAYDVDDDEDAPGDHGYAGDGGARLAPMVIGRALSASSSVLGWVIAHEWKARRNRKEAEVVAQAIDAAMDEGLDPETSDTLEILARRIAGLGEADSSSNWAMCDAIQLPTSASHLLDLPTLEKVARTAAAFQRVEARAQPKRGGGGFQQSRYTRGRGGRGRGGGQGANASESAGQKTSRAGHQAGAAAQ